MMEESKRRGEKEEVRKGRASKVYYKCSSCSGNGFGSGDRERSGSGGSLGSGYDGSLGLGLGPSAGFIKSSGSSFGGGVLGSCSGLGISVLFELALALALAAARAAISECSGSGLG